MSQVHPMARTTPRTRAEIRASSAPLTALAERYCVFRRSVTDRFGSVTAEFGSVTGQSGDVTGGRLVAA